MHLDARLNNGTIGYAGLAVQDTRNTATRERLANSPRFLANGGISIPLHSNKLFVSPELQYVGSRRTLSGGTADPFALFNLIVGSQTPIRGYDLRLCVYNLFDADIHVPGSPEHIQDLIPQEGRTVWLQASRMF